MNRNWVFFLEEPSAEDFLRGFLGSRTPADVTLHFQVFEGKQDLEKQLVTCVTDAARRSGVPLLDFQSLD